MSSVHYSSKTFVQAAEIAEKIEQLEKQLSSLLQGENSVAVKTSAPSAPKAAPKRRVSAPKKAEKTEASSEPKAAEEGRGRREDARDLRARDAVVFQVDEAGLLEAAEEGVGGGLLFGGRAGEEEREVD